MFISLSNVLIILEKYRYFVIFPIVVFEGPIIIIISGFLVYLGYLNIFIAFTILVAGDLVGDSLYYAVGRYGKRFAWIKRMGHFLGYDKKIKELLRNHFEKHTGKTLLLGKVTHGLGGAIQVTAGIAEVDFFQYFLIELIGTMPKTLILLAVGLYLGSSYEKIDTYLDSVALIMIGLVFLTFLYLILSKHVKNYLVKKE